ncbi:hypothetical protein F4780DRAFT_535823 [Xylariomycetidae sp. FL0641]|nr:hypothetical protein F4780DRAFT_535823 [Xylariomycetidae sp. FL0641]
MSCRAGCAPVPTCSSRYLLHVIRAWHFPICVLSLIYIVLSRGSVPDCSCFASSACSFNPLVTNPPFVCSTPVAGPATVYHCRLPTFPSFSTSCSTLGSIRLGTSVSAASAVGGVLVYRRPQVRENKRPPPTSSTLGLPTLCLWRREPHSRHVQHPSDRVP